MYAALFVSSKNIFSIHQKQAVQVHILFLYISLNNYKSIEKTQSVRKTF